jgi:O-glycosyl hydrolase
MKKNRTLFLGILSVLLVFGIMFAGCTFSGDSEDDEDTIINAVKPVISAHPYSSIYAKDATAASLTVEAAVSDGGALSYQWYSNTAKASTGGTLIPDETAVSYTPSTAAIGGVYYYVVVTNTNNNALNKTASAVSSIALIDVRSDTSFAAAQATITVNTSTRYQNVTGFGGMSQVWGSPDVTVRDIDTMFSPDGLGYNILRVCVYPYMDDVLNNNENPEVDNSDYFELAKRAQKYGALIEASPWTPPSEWKTNGSRVGGGHLKAENYGDYLQHLKDYVALMERNGVKVNALSYQNEPDIAVSYDGCDWEPEEMLDFIKMAGRSIQDAYPYVRIIPGESFQFRRAFTDPILNDAEAVNYIDIIGGHIYGGGHSQYALAEQKGKEIWMTEHLLNTSSNFNYDSTWAAMWPVVKEVHDSMTYGWNAFIWWYSKRFYSLIGDGQYQTVDGAVLPRGYALSHYAKYAAGKTRVAADLVTSIGANSIFVTAYEGDNDISLVMFNQSSTSAEVVNIVIPVAARSVSGVITRPVGNAATTREIVGMENEAIFLSADKKTGTLALPASTIISVKFVK